MEASQIQHGKPRRLVMSAPTPLRQDFDAPQVRGLARKTKDGPQARRLLALGAIYDGATRTEAAKIGGVGLQIIRDWVLRFNAHGLPAETATMPCKPANWFLTCLSSFLRDGCNRDGWIKILVALRSSWAKSQACPQHPGAGAASRQFGRVFAPW
jgi:hypothetical protein